MQRRDLLRKIGLGAILAPAVIPAMMQAAAEEPKPNTGEWYVGGGPQCPECGMTMDCSWRSEDKKRVVFMHPAAHSNGEGGLTPWSCKNAGRKFYYPTQQLEEYRGAMRKPW